MTRLSHTILALMLAALAACYTSFEEGPSATPATPPRTAPAPASRPATRPVEKRRTVNGKKKKPEQSYREAWRVICHAETLSGVSSGSSPKERQAAVTHWIVEHLKNTEARYWFIGMGNLKPEQRLPHFIAEARRVGFASCPVTPLLFAPAAAARGPGSQPSAPR